MELTKDEFENLTVEAVKKAGFLSMDEMENRIRETEAKAEELVKNMIGEIQNKALAEDKRALSNMVGQWLAADAQATILRKQGGDVSTKHTEKIEYGNRLASITPRSPYLVEEKVLGTVAVPWLPITLVSDWYKDATTKWPIWVRPQARIWNTTAKRIHVPVIYDSNYYTIQFIGEGHETGPVCNDIAACKETLEWFKAAACMEIYSLLEVQDPALAAIIPQLLVGRFVKGEEFFYWLGRGSAEGEPSGIAPTVLTGTETTWQTYLLPTLEQLMLDVRDWDSPNAAFYCSSDVYDWLYKALDAIGGILLVDTPGTTESIGRRFRIKGLNKWVCRVPALDLTYQQSTYNTYLFYGDMGHYHLIQHSGDGIIPLMGIVRVGNTDRENALLEKETYIIHGLIGGLLNFGEGQGETCPRKTWSYVDLSDQITTSYREGVRIEGEG